MTTDKVTLFMKKINYVTSSLLVTRRLLRCDILNIMFNVVD